MNFIGALQARLNRQVQVSTEARTYAGILIAVGSESITIRTSNYGPIEEVTIMIDLINFVRVFSF